MSQPRFYFFLLTVLASFICDAQKHKTDVESNDLIGKVRYMREESNLPADSLEYDPEMGSDTRVYYYNKNGTLNLYILFINNIADSFKVYQDYLGRKTDYFSDRVDSTGSEDCFWESYNEKGDKIVTTYFSKHVGRWYAMITRYNEKGDHIEDDMINSDISLNSVNLIYNSYDNNGQLVEESILDGAKKTKSKIVYEYDSLCNKTCQSYYKRDSILSYKVIFKYDEKPKLIAKTIYEADLSIYSLENYTYDEHNNPIQFFSDKKYKQRGADFTITYKYDDHGNWIKKIEDVKGRKKLSMIFRTVEYYD